MMLSQAAARLCLYQAIKALDPVGLLPTAYYCQLPKRYALVTIFVAARGRLPCRGIIQSSFGVLYGERRAPAQTLGRLSQLGCSIRLTVDAPLSGI